MVQVILLGACVACLLALSLHVARAYLDDDSPAVGAQRSPGTTWRWSALFVPEQASLRPAVDRVPVYDVSERQILQEARKLTREVEEYLANQPH